SLSMHICMARWAHSSPPSHCWRWRRGAGAYNLHFFKRVRRTMSLAFVFPGQGSQSIGMLGSLGAEPLVQSTFADAMEVLGYDLWKLCQEGPEADLNATERTQPAMLTAGVATWRLWR